MLKFKLIENTENKAVYEYYPEGGASVGIVSYDKGTRSNSIVNLSTDDRHKRYALKMLAKLREFAQRGAFETDGTIAWY